MMRMLVLVWMWSIVSVARGHADCKLATAGGKNLAGAQRDVNTARDAKDVAERVLTVARSSKDKNLPAYVADVATTSTALDLARAELEFALNDAATNSVEVTVQPARVGITLSSPPSERLRVAFDLTTGAHHEIEWDPAVDTSLTRTVTLEPGTWSVTASAEAQTFNQQAGTVVIQVRFGGLELKDEKQSQGNLDGVYVALGIAAAGGALAPTVVSAWPRPRLAFVCGPTVTSTIAQQQFAGSVTTSGVDGGVRGFGVAPAIVTDTLALLAEIAIDRARAGALGVLKRRLVNPFCLNDDTRISLDRLTLGDRDELALPRTCELLLSLRLDDVLSSGRPILLALRDDLRFTIAPEVARKLSGNNAHKLAVMRAVVSIVNTMIDRGGFDALQGQLSLELLAQLEHVGLAQVGLIRAQLEGHLANELTTLPQLSVIATAVSKPCTAAVCTGIEAAAVATEVLDRMLKAPLNLGWSWADTATKAPVATAVVKSIVALNSAPLTEALAYGCQARLIVAIVKRCSGGGCSAADLVAMVDKPNEHFAVEEELPGALCWNGDQYLRVQDNTDAAAVQRLVIDGLALVGPVADGQGRDRARAAVRLIIQLEQRVGADTQLPMAMLSAFGDLAVAIIDEDYGSAFGRFLSLVDRFKPEESRHKVVRTFAQLIGAVASYAVVYRETKDSDPQAAREARKRALSAIIDGMTDRAERGDELVVSLGSNVGLSFSRRNVDRRSGAGIEDDAWRPAVRVPLGVRLECLRKRDATRLSGLGGFVSFNVIDLGQFVRSDEDEDFADVAWADFVGIGLEAGVSHTWFGRELNLSAHATYAPSIRYKADDADNADGAGVWTYGVALGYYVPFIDLN